MPPRKRTLAEASAEFRAACLALLDAVPGIDWVLTRLNRFAVWLGFGDGPDDGR